MRTYLTLTVGQLLERLEHAPDDGWVVFDFCRMRPFNIHCYRGYYEHLALSYTSDYGSTSVKGFKEMLNSTINKVYQGYKGGSYTMSRDSEVFVDKAGEATGTVIVDLVIKGKEVMIVTTNEDAKL